MKKDYLKKICLLLLVLIFGYNVPKSSGKIHSSKTVEYFTEVEEIPILNKENVLIILKCKNIPHPEIVLRQSILETGHYKSKLCRTHNNIFGIRKNNKYAKYNSWVECIDDYKKRITSRYKGGDYYNFLKRINYAEDDTYINKLKQIKV